MGRRTSGRGGGGTASVLKERANMSFMLVVMFFAVFGLIVLTEIFLIDERHGIGAGGAALGARGRAAHHRLAAAPDRPDYEEIGAALLKRRGMSECICLTTGQSPIKGEDRGVRKHRGLRTDARPHHHGDREMFFCY
ncbi:hypothetical protein TKK_0004581 [Trichogramma kaykai]